jgi:hypothetical protein
MYRKEAGLFWVGMLSLRLPGGGYVWWKHGKFMLAKTTWRYLSVRTAEPPELLIPQDLETVKTGIGLTTLTEHNLREGDKVKVKFMKGDRKTSEIEKTAIVRRVATDNYVGCKFSDAV